MSSNSAEVAKPYNNGRALSYLISYVAVSWGILQFTDWLVKRYAYSNAWVDVLLVMLVLMIPAVIIFALSFGAERLNKSTCYWAVPLNFVFAGVILFFVFNGIALGSTSQDITVVDENGETIERVMPTAAFTKRMVFFPTEKSDYTDENRWLSYALPLMQSTDLEQNKRFYNFDAFSLKENIERYEYSVMDKIPFAVMRKIAEDRFSDFFVKSEMLTIEPTVRVKFEVFSTTDGELFKEQLVEGEDIYAVVDQFTKDIEGQIFSKEINLKEEKAFDLPASDLFSSNMEALEAYVRGFVESKWNNNPQLSLQYFQKAIQLDPDFAMAHASVGSVYYGLGMPEQGGQAFEKAMNLIEPLPERMQFSVKSQNYLFKNELDKSLRLMEMWRSLYPNDYLPYTRLFDLYSMTSNLEKAEEVGLAALENGHVGPMYQRLGDLYVKKGNYEEAENYFKLYKEAFPGKAKSSVDLGNLYLTMGDYDKAKEFFEERTVLNPNEYKNYIFLGSIAGKEGNRDQEFKQYDKALRLAKQAADTIAVYRNIEAALERGGRIKECMELMDTRRKLMDKYYPPLVSNAEFFRYDLMGRYLSVGKDEELLAKIKEIAPSFSNSQIDVECAAMLNYYCLKEDGEKIQEIWNKCPEAVEQSSIGAMVFFMEGVKEKALGNYDKAIENYNTFLTNSGAGSEFMISVDIFDAYRLKGDYDKAIKGLTDLSAEYPEYPALSYKLALAHRDNGNTGKATKAADTALKILERSDEEYKLFQDLKALKEELVTM